MTATGRPLSVISSFVYVLHHAPYENDKCGERKKFNDRCDDIVRYFLDERIERSHSHIIPKARAYARAFGPVKGITLLRMNLLRLRERRLKVVRLNRADKDVYETPDGHH